MLQNPARERVSHGYYLADSVLQAKVEGPELSSEASNSNLSASTGLTIIGLTVLERGALDALDLYAHGLESLLGQ